MVIELPHQCNSRSDEAYPYPSTRCTGEVGHGPFVIIVFTEDKRGNTIGRDRETWGHCNEETMTYWHENLTIHERPTV